MARDLTIKSSAASDKDHRGALENWAHQSIFYRCSFMGSHATIWAYEGRQFYRDCQIQGSHYFIQGDAPAIFQQCRINSFKIHAEEKVVISGQSQRSLMSNSAFVFHLCEFFTMRSVIASSEETYLGGAPEAYSKTVVMQSFLDASIAGWFVNDSTPHTVYFGEFNNRGPGANFRTNSPCIHFIDDLSTASHFTVRVFLNGTNWLPQDVPYAADIV
ncbi:unnamed protein product [Ilex paraguariensis]